MKYLLDTNICVFVIRQKSHEVLQHLRRHPAGDVGISTITLAELRYGADKSRDPTKNHAALDAFLAPLEIVDFDAAAANRIRWADALFTGPPRRPLAAIQVMEPAVQWYRRSRREDLLAPSLAKWGGLLLNLPDRFEEAEKILLEALALAKKENDDIAR